MKTTVTRRTVDLRNYPDLVVIYLGMRVNSLAGIKTRIRFRPQDQRLGRCTAGRTSAPRERALVAVSTTHWHTPVLAGLRVPGTLGAIKATPGLVAKLPAALGWHGILARDLSHEGRNGGGLRRPANALRNDEVCAGGPSPRLDVQRQAARGSRRAGAVGVSSRRGRAVCHRLTPNLHPAGQCRHTPVTRSVDDRPVQVAAGVGRLGGVRRYAVSALRPAVWVAESVPGLPPPWCQGAAVARITTSAGSLKKLARALT